MDKVIGLDDVRAELVIVKTPGGSGKLELIKFHLRVHGLVGCARLGHAAVL
jgi:hypothetical protein